MSFRDDAEARRYELDHDGGPSFARYRDADGVRATLHVETPLAARGHGHASDLMRAIVLDARARGLKLRPICSFAVTHFRRDATAGDVLA